MDKLSELKKINDEIQMQKKEVEELHKKRNLIKQEYINEQTKMWSDTPVLIKQDNYYGVVKEAYDIDKFRVNVIEINHNKKVVSSYKNYSCNELIEVTNEELKDYLYMRVLSVL